MNLSDTAIFIVGLVVTAIVAVAVVLCLVVGRLEQQSMSEAEREMNR